MLLRYLPTSPVRCPESCSHVANVDSSSPRLRKRTAPPSGTSLAAIWWLWGYCPRRAVAREGQQRDCVTKALSKVTPSSIMRERTTGIRASIFSSMSSVITNTMFGLSSADRSPIASPERAEASGPAMPTSLPASPRPQPVARNSIKARDTMAARNTLIQYPHPWHHILDVRRRFFTAVTLLALEASTDYACPV